MALSFANAQSFGCARSFRGARSFGGAWSFRALDRSGRSVIGASSVPARTDAEAGSPCELPASAAILVLSRWLLRRAGYFLVPRGLLSAWGLSAACALLARAALAGAAASVLLVRADLAAAPSALAFAVLGLAARVLVARGFAVGTAAVVALAAGLAVAVSALALLACAVEGRAVSAVLAVAA